MGDPQDFLSEPATIPLAILPRTDADAVADAWMKRGAQAKRRRELLAAVRGGGK
jgi:hypothetical protein